LTIIFTNGVSKRVLMEERKWYIAISQCHTMSLYMQIHCTLRPIHILSILNDNRGLRLSINCLLQLTSMKIISKECASRRKYASDYNMFVLLSCFDVLTEREHFLENLLDLLTPPRHLILPSHLSEVRVALHSIL
jgi:hypothetical protein